LKGKMAVVGLRIVGGCKSAGSDVAASQRLRPLSFKVRGCLAIAQNFDFTMVTMNRALALSSMYF